MTARYLVGDMFDGIGEYVNVTTQDELDRLPADVVAVVREGSFDVAGDRQVSPAYCDVICARRCVAPAETEEE